MGYSNKVDDLNEQQRTAATASDGPVAIIAGPGTGKTKTLTARLGFLVANGVAPAKILALTFTKKAAEEMIARYKISEAVNTATPCISTFHALCFALLKERLGKAPQIIPEPARLALIKSLSKPAELKTVSTRELSLLLSRAKNMADNNPAVQRLLTAYNAELAAQTLCDFDDILVQTRDLLRDDANWREVIKGRFTHILVDEFQDTNALQYQLLQLIRQTDNVFVIGDPQQSIYGFRGADGDIFATFIQDFPQAQVVTLAINYRSVPQIVAVANAVYPDVPALLAHVTTAGAVCAVEVLNEYSEANWVLAEIQKVIGGSDLLRAESGGGLHTRYGFNDIAVLYRSRNVARIVQNMLVASGIPVQVVGEGSPYEAPQVQAVIALLANLLDADRPATVRGFTPGQVRALVAKLDANQPPHRLAEAVMDAFGMTPDASLRQVLAVLVQHQTLAEAVAYFDAIATQDFYDPRAAAVTMLTIHAAKGLEFAHVFVVGAEEGVLPSARGDMAEEKRLFYVAATRAKERLDVLHARTRAGQKATMSHFITEISDDILPRMIDTALAVDQRRTQKRRAKRAQTSFF